VIAGPISSSFGFGFGCCHQVQQTYKPVCCEHAGFSAYISVVVELY